MEGLWSDPGFLKLQSLFGNYVVFLFLVLLEKWHKSCLIELKCWQRFRSYLFETQIGTWIMFNPGSRWSRPFKSFGIYVFLMKQVKLVNLNSNLMFIYCLLGTIELKTCEVWGLTCGYQSFINFFCQTLVSCGDA